MFVLSYSGTLGEAGAEELRILYALGAAAGEGGEGGVGARGRDAQLPAEDGGGGRANGRRPPPGGAPFDLEIAKVLA